jgi:hypothetical protein
MSEWSWGWSRHERGEGGAEGGRVSGRSPSSSAAASSPLLSPDSIHHYLLLEEAKPSDSPACLRPPPDLLRSASRWQVHLAVHRPPRWHESFGHCDCAEAEEDLTAVFSCSCSSSALATHYGPCTVIGYLYFFAPFCGLARRKARAGRLKNARRLCVVEDFGHQLHLRPRPMNGRCPFTCHTCGKHGAHTYDEQTLMEGNRLTTVGVRQATSSPITSLAPASASYHLNDWGIQWCC